jgi:hypothetical protein
MSNHYELFETNVGILVMFKDELIALHEYVRLFDVIDENPHFLTDLKGFIVDGFGAHADSAVENFKTPAHMATLDGVQVYVNAMRIYSILANQEYPRYRHARQEAMKLD